jgi:dGTPase
MQPRLIAHYIAGMTDRYAVKEYQRLFVIDDN